MPDDEKKFEELVFRALEQLPERFKERLENVDIVIQDRPTKDQREQVGARGEYDLLGLYEGVPLTERTTSYNMVLPDKITIFRKPLESLRLSQKELEREIEETVRHELAHHFGISDQRLEDLQREKGQGRWRHER